MFYSIIQCSISPYFTYRFAVLAIYTIFVLDTINAEVNLKQFSPIVLICVETM